MEIFKRIKKYIKEEIYNLKQHHRLKLLTIILLIVLCPITIPVAIICFSIGIIISIIPGKKEYDKSEYKIITGENYLNIIFDLGKVAEYFTWKILNAQPEYKRVLINLCIPKDNNKTTEIDSILINKYGIFVIESKGYSGWIFGKENDQRWTQVIYQKKTKFYNPVLQNRNHIIHLAELLNIEDMNIFKSYIVFSNRCKLKKVKITKRNLRVIKRDYLNKTLQEDYNKTKEVSSEERIKEIGDKLLKYMINNNDIKEKHIKDIKRTIGYKEQIKS